MSDSKPITSAATDNTGTTIRWAVTFALGLMFSRGVISQETYDQLFAGIPAVIGFLLVLVPLVQSFWAKWRSRQKTEQAVDVALALPVTATKADVVAEIAKQPDLPLLPKITSGGSTALPMLALVLLVAFGSNSCQTLGIGDGKPVVVDSSISQQNAKRALIELQDARTLLLKSMATIYMAAPHDANVIDAVRAVDRYDAKFREAWQLAALAADSWNSVLFSLRYSEARDQVELMKVEVNK